MVFVGKTIKLVCALNLICILMFVGLPLLADGFSYAATNAPAKVTNLTVKNVGKTSVTIQWRRVSKAKGYVIYRNGSTIADTKSVSFTDENLSPGNQYTYKVKAYKIKIETKTKYYNSKTEKWQFKKPKNNEWKGKKTKRVRARVKVYGKASPSKKVITKAFSGGAGKSSDPYRISSAQDLITLSKLMAGSRSKNYQKASYELTTDIDLSGYQWLPIGGKAIERVSGAISIIEPSKEFKGNVDGKGHTISNLSITPLKKVYTYGLFGTINHAKIKNLNLENISVSGKFPSKCRYIGTLAGNADSDSAMNTIENCHVSGLNIDITETEAACGGLVGFCEYSYLYDSSVSGTIKVAAKEHASVAGFVTDAYQCEIRNCSFTGSISSVSEETAYVSGFVNENYQTTSITNCICVATVRSVCKEEEILFPVDTDIYETQYETHGDVSGFSQSHTVGEAYFRNLIFSGEVYQNNRRQRDAFGSVPSGDHKHNIVEVSGNDIRMNVFREGYGGYIEEYENVQDYREFFETKLGFDSDNWDFSKTELPTLKKHVYPACDHNYESTENNVLICKNCGKLVCNH